MIRKFIVAGLLCSATVALAQSAEDRLGKARAEVNTVENTADRAVYHCSRGNMARCNEETRNAANAASRALYAVDRAIEAVNAEHQSPIPTPSPTPTPTPVPTEPAPPPPEPGGWIASPTLDGAPDLVASFPVADALVPSWGSGEVPGPYGPGEGAFRLTCGAEGPLRFDDPLVKPGQPGKAHLHLFWGPTSINANTTVATLAASIGNSTCNYGPLTVNRSAYWAPALLDAQDRVRNADWIAVYYKRSTASSPACTPGSPIFMGTCVGLPNQIRFVFGWDQFNPDAPIIGASWYCTGSGSMHVNDLDKLFQAGCKVGDTLVADMAAPNCWSGKHLDAPDHRSHLAYGSYGNWGYYKCPATHPYVIPQNESKIAWTVIASDFGPDENGVLRARLHLSSDHMRPGSPPGYTLHSDYIEQWVGAVKRMWLDNCINKGLNCSGGDLGNGLQVPGAAQPSYGWTALTPTRPQPAS